MEWTGLAMLSTMVRGWARTHARRGDLHKSLSVAESAINCMGSISSPRTVKALRDLDQDLANLRSSRNLPEVRSLRSELQQVLADVSNSRFR